MDSHWFTRVTTRALSVIAGGALVCLPLAHRLRILSRMQTMRRRNDGDVHQLPWLGGAAQRTDDRRGRDGWQARACCDGRAAASAHHGPYGPGSAGAAGQYRDVQHLHP